MNIIVAVDNNWGIGYRGNLLVSIPQDRHLFRDETTGKVIIMGRKTLESLPNKKPLPNRTNVILTHDPNYCVSTTMVGETAVYVVHSVDETMKLLKELDVNSEDVFVIGGEQVYREFLPFCDVCHVTYVDYRYNADRHFPNLDEDPQWVLAVESDEQTYFDLEYYFRMYCRRR